MPEQKHTTMCAMVISALIYMQKQARKQALMLCMGSETERFCIGIQYTTINKFGVGKSFKCFLCSPRLHLFDWKYICIPVMAYCPQCHMILQKSFLYADISMIINDYHCCQQLCCLIFVLRIRILLWTLYILIQFNFFKKTQQK